LFFWRPAPALCSPGEPLQARHSLITEHQPDVEVPHALGWSSHRFSIIAALPIVTITGAATR
jgi:hypothetical protein